MKNEHIDTIRRELLRTICNVLVDAKVSDSIRQSCIDQTAEIIDSLIRGVAQFTHDLGRRETRAVSEFVFTRAFPLISSVVVPALMVAQGTQEAAVKLAADILEAHRRNSNNDEGKG